ncbi:2-acylglycerol O-acyltransferase 2-A-like [Montipora capricornis]|uniref:2-acylglycerol O-acyltransferase 2-A-like n=1 Tax=Montipora capricornis TaxID=246305 RepID=UPI0035F13D3C
MRHEYPLSRETSKIHEVTNSKDQDFTLGIKATSHFHETGVKEYFFFRQKMSRKQRQGILTRNSFSFRMYKEPLQFLVALFKALVFVFGHTIAILLTLYILLTPLYGIMVVYLLWTYCFDLKRSSKGGRRSETFRRLKSWEYLRDYFPVRLIRTEKLDPDRNYIMGYHPHGIMCAGAWTNFATEATGYSSLFPGIKAHLLTLTLVFKFPIFRDYLMAAGICDVSKESIQHILTQQGNGNAVIIAIGGAAESLDAHPGSYTLTLRHRKGFAKMALRTGAYLVPVFSFGENDLFNQVSNPRGSRLRTFQTKLMKVLSFAPPLFFGRGFSPKLIGFAPHRKPISTVVGAPIRVKRVVPNPSAAQVNRLHKKYVHGLVSLFEEHKHRYGLPKSVKLTIV